MSTIVLLLSSLLASSLVSLAQVTSDSDDLIAPCANVAAGVSCCDIPQTYFHANAVFQSTQSSTGRFDIVCRAHSATDSLSAYITPSARLLKFATTNNGAAIEDATGLAGIGVKTLLASGQTSSDAANLLDVVGEGITVRFGALVNVQSVRLAAFTPPPTGVNPTSWNHVQISCGRDLGNLPQKTGLQAKNVLGDLNGVDVSLGQFTAVNLCNILYVDGPGFALSSISWTPYAFDAGNGAEVDFAKALKKELAEEARLVHQQRGHNQH